MAIPFVLVTEYLSFWLPSVIMAPQRLASNAFVLIPGIPIKAGNIGMVLSGDGI